MYPSLQIVFILTKNYDNLLINQSGVFLIDYKLFENIHNLAGKNISLDWVMSQLSTYGYIVFIAIILLLLVFPHKRKLGIIGFLSLVIALAVNRLLKVSIDRARPFVDHEIDILIPKDPSPSFPSDQALIAGVFTGLFLFSNAKIGIKIGIIFIALLVIISRVFVGHHYPADVAVGFLLGGFISFLTKKIIDRKKLEKVDKIPA